MLLLCNPKTSGMSMEYNMNLSDMTLLDMVAACDAIGIDIDTHADLIEDMYWDGHPAREIKEMIQVLEGDCSICVD